MATGNSGRLNMKIENSEDNFALRCALRTAARTIMIGPHPLSEESRQLLREWADLLNRLYQDMETYPKVDVK